MKRNRPPSPQTLKVLAALAEWPSDWLYGLQIAEATGLASGSLYPILIRCAERDLLASQWLEPASPGRPPRHAYRITATGLSALGETSERQAQASFKEKPA